jgi:hypothetical protein
MSEQDTRDAERYRFLRDSAINSKGYSAWCVQGTDYRDSFPCLGANLDQLVDRGMRRMNALGGTGCGKDAEGARKKPL